MHIFMLKPKKDGQIVDICAGWTGLEQIAQFLKIGMCIVLTQEGLSIDPKPLPSLVTLPHYYGTRRIGGTIFAVRGEGDEHGVFKSIHFYGSGEGEFLVAPAFAAPMQGDGGFTACDPTKWTRVLALEISAQLFGNLAGFALPCIAEEMRFKAERLRHLQPGFGGE